MIFVLALGSAVAIAQPAPAPVEEPMPPPPSTMRQPEQLAHKPSGFRLPNVPAKGGAYRYRMLGLGAVVVGITALLTARYLRRMGRERVAREREPTTS